MSADQSGNKFNLVKKEINPDLAYFEQEVKYDKRFYVNTPLDVIQILGALIAYYCLHILIFWGHCALGSTQPEEAMWLNVALFIFANVWIFSMAFFGHFQNTKYALHQFYLKKINDKEQENKEKKQRDEQKKNQEAKIADANLRAGSESQY